MPHAPSRLARPALLGLILASALGGPVRAGYVVDVTESGGDVVAAGSGTINTAGLTSSHTNGPVWAELNPSGGLAAFGPAAGSEITFFTGISGPSAFGSTDTSFASGGSGDLVGVFGIIDEMYLPMNYASGSPLTSTSTWGGQGFASLGLTPGTYTWTWGSGADADSFTMNIIGGAAVPEPAGLAMLGTGALAVLVFARRRRRAAA